MAGIGVTLNRIFKKNTITTTLAGVGYSMMITIAPMILVIGTLLLMFVVLGFDSIGYAERELFSISLLYVFIFSLIITAPFSAVISRYVADQIYEEKYDEILPCFYTGLVLNMGVAVLLAIPFYIREVVVGGVSPFYVFNTFCAFISMVLAFYSMLYLSVAKDYTKISLFFLIGMTVTFCLSYIFVKWIKMGITVGMQLGISIGIFLIAVLEFSYIKGYFNRNSQNYKGVLAYFRKYWKLFFTNLFYTLGLFSHNFVFWTTDMKMIVADTYVCNQPYDLASCLAMFTNISASVIFIVQIETRFHKIYQKYSEMVIGGKLRDIQKEKEKMFRSLSQILVDLVKLQFIISVVIYLLAVVVLPSFGISGLVMKIYPCLAAGYFIVFIMYGLMLFLFYFDDLTGALLLAFCFFAATLIASIGALRLPIAWYGIGLFIGTLIGWTVGYFRIHWLEKHFDQHIFCQGSLLEKKQNQMPSARVYEKAPENRE